MGRLALRLAVALVCVLAVGWTAGLVGLAAYTHHKLANVPSKADLGSQDLAAQATAYITDAAAQQGYGVKNIRVTRVVRKASSATVYATVTLTYGGESQTVKLKVGFHKGVWNATGLQPA